MSNFSTFYLTRKGIDLQTKVQNGAVLKFTRVAVGDGIIENPSSLVELENLVQYRTSYNINDIINKGDGTSVIKTIISNRDLEEGFFLREIGVFADDPDLGEILYCVTNTGTYTDYLPARTLNSVDIVLEIITVVGNAESVVIEIDDSLVYVTRKEFESLAGNGRTTENVKENADDLLNVKIELAMIKDSSMNNITSNMFLKKFEDLIITDNFEGIWDKLGKRLVI